VFWEWIYLQERCFQNFISNFWTFINVHIEESNVALLKARTSNWSINLFVVSLD